MLSHCENIGDMRGIWWNHVDVDSRNKWNHVRVGKGSMKVDGFF